MEILEKTDTNLRIYLSILIISWVVIIFYLMYISKHEENIKSIETYPYNHSEITDSTLKQK